MNVTLHSLDRAKERNHMNETEAKRFIDLAAERGKFSDEMPNRERRYMEAKEACAGCIAVYYNRFLFIYTSDGTCVTLYRAPSWFCGKQFYAKKEKIRDPKKYLRYSIAA